ncbi:unnamed protein product [Calypogeia fissa]
MDRYIGKKRDVNWKAVLPHPPPKLNALTPKEIIERKAIGLHLKDDRWAFGRCLHKTNLLDDIFDEMKAHLKEIADREKLEEEKRRKKKMEAQQQQVEANWEH